MNVIAKVQCSESVDFFRPDRPRPTQNQTDPTQVDFRPKSTFLLWTETRTYLLSSLYCVRLPLPNIVMGLTQVDELAHFIQVACFDVRNNSVTGKQFVSKNYVKSTYSAIYATQCGNYTNFTITNFESFWGKSREITAKFFLSAHLVLKMLHYDFKL